MWEMGVGGEVGGGEVGGGEEGGRMEGWGDRGRPPPSHLDARCGQISTETNNSRHFRKIIILSLSLKSRSRSCWNANAGEILAARSRPRLCKIRTLSSISRFENESPKKLASLPSLGLDSRSRFSDLSFHSQLWF